MESDSIHSEQDKNDVMKITDPNEVCGQSGVYMFIFYTVSLLVIGSMIFHYLSLRGLFPKLPEGSVSTEAIDASDDSNNTFLFAAFSGSTAHIVICGFFSFKTSPMPVIVPPVPIPEQKPSIGPLT